MTAYLNRISEYKALPQEKLSEMAAELEQLGNEDNLSVATAYICISEVVIIIVYSMLFSYKKEDAAVAAAAVKFLCNRFYQKSFRYCPVNHCVMFDICFLFLPLCRSL